jgi:glycosyltransferase involved in cell wall biosynthesis
MAPSLGKRLSAVTVVHSGSPRVLVVINRLTRGGAERHLVKVLPALTAKGITVELFLFERGGELESELVEARVPLHGVHGGLSFMRLIASAIALYRHIRATRPDIVHFFLPKSYIVGSLVALVARHRMCLMSRRSLTHYHRDHPWLARLEKRLHRHMSAFLGNSRAVVDELVAEVGSGRNVGLIYNGVDIVPLVDEFGRTMQRAALGFPSDAFVMVIVANLIAYKGHVDLLDALHLASASLPQPWRLMVIGRDDGIGSQLKAQAARLGLSDNVIWMGERSDVEAILPAADAGLLVSHQEGFSNALIEAMGQGLPVIATSVGGNIDAIVDGKTGRLVPVRDPVSLSNAIVEMSSNPEARAAMGQAARERTMMMFSQASCVDRYERLYRGIGKMTEQPLQAIIDGTQLSATQPPRPAIQAD